MICVGLFTAFYISCYFICKYELANILFVAIITAISIGIINTIFYLTANSMLLDIIDKEDLQYVYPVVSAIDSVSYLSNFIGMIVYEFVGIHNIFLTGTFLFIMSFIVVSKIDITYKKKYSADKETYSKRMSEGLEIIKSRKGLSLLVILSCLCFANSGVRQVSWVPYFRELSPLWLYIIYGAFSAGTFHSSVILSLIKIKNRMRYILFLICIMISFSIESLVVFVPLIVASIFSYIAGLCYGLAYNIMTVSILEKLDEKTKTRYLGFYESAINLATICGMMFATLSSDLLDIKVISSIPKIIVILFVVIKIAFNNRIVSLFTKQD